MKTLEVKVGSIGIGGDNPIRVQSMTNTLTSDTVASVNQVTAISAAGADLVRLTVRNMQEAVNLAEIKRLLKARQCHIPLVADVHFNPDLAEVAARHVEKVRINPGNYGIRQKPGSKVLTDSEFEADVARAREKFCRLLGICRQHGTALRVGVNHGSLSSRILNRYGNTPAGMVESAMEFLRFCAEEDFHQVVVSLKSSNTKVMTAANIMMAETMKEANMFYPLHLGVTEAGEGDDGRVRSAAGIGTLLALGLGDTIRVSLTEDPEKELPVARKLVSFTSGYRSSSLSSLDISSGYLSPSSRVTKKTGNIGGEQVPVVIASQEDSNRETPSADEPAPDYIFSPRGRIFEPQPAAAIIVPFHAPRIDSSPPTHLLYTPDQYPGGKPGPSTRFLIVSRGDMASAIAGKVKNDPRLVLVYCSDKESSALEFVTFIRNIRESGCNNPVILKKKYNHADREDFQVHAAVDFSPVLLSGEAQGIWIENSSTGYSFNISLAFSILQSCRRRTSKTEFISCPSCGRTMFDIQKATSSIKKRTSHLSGLKIAVMGCIVNGPGEMADADYGYVGSGKGKVSLYKKQEMVRRNVPEEQAVDQLIALIRESGDWKGES
jgi:(E)-4-hydroxy-3-methylbut-2-enyl-diphosphate synthase